MLPSGRSNPNAGSASAARMPVPKGLPGRGAAAVVVVAVVWIDSLVEPAAVKDALVNEQVDLLGSPEQAIVTAGLKVDPVGVASTLKV